MGIHEIILQELKRFEDDPQSVIDSEDNILSIIRAKIPEGTEIDDYSMAEVRAFSFIENSDYGQKNWKTYFGPTYHVISDNEYVEHFKLSDITDKTIGYWETRSISCKHPALIARYAGLVWVFKGKLTAKKPEPSTTGKLYIESLIKCFKEGRYSSSNSLYTKLRRAAELASTLKFEDLKMEAIDSIIDLENAIVRMDLAGTWLRSFEILVDNKHIPISDEMTNNLIERLENAFMLCLEKEGQRSYERHSADEAFKVLAKYYLRHKRTDDLIRIVSKIHKVYDELIDNAEEFRKHILTEKLYFHIKKYGSKDQINALLKRLRKNESTLIRHLKPYSIEMEIPRDVFIHYSEKALAGSFEEVLHRIALESIPNTDLIPTQAQGIYDLINKSIHDEHGRKLSSIKGLKEDPEGNKIHSLSKHLDLSSVFLRDVIKKGKERHIITLENVMSHMRQSTIFYPERHKILEKGIHAFLKRDFTIAMHLIIPQIESACLNLLDQADGNVRREGKNNGMNVRMFDSILSDHTFVNTVSPNTATYLRTVLTSDQGWNLRNIVCHGLSTGQTFSEKHANRLFVILLYLGVYVYTDHVPEP
ncbi:DUF4209 domain-containing protein [Chitinophaga oryziterrae]|uniref:DUF4209 domain-containing protein n=1 Tax=Chitinophaga oryziterrae TaxID=1031224 RepID=A0A6N8JCN1_9BACT|nr:DUF4209 domain-containing protein [Chitinophaga oryziterrae]MVT42188.1 DUF4209 domain-containing protein [Chitinophaga oryziterrae]